MGLIDAIIELYRQASCELSSDVAKALKDGLKKEKKNSLAYDTLKTILKNVNLARKNSLPICQDTGYPTFYVYYSKKFDTNKIKNAVIKATKIAVKKNYLRPNAVDSLTGVNSKDSTGLGMPKIYFYEWQKKELKIELLLKGGGSENVSVQYSLPDRRLKAGRDIEGVKKCILDAVVKAQGKGCAPGVLGVCIGGDRASGYEFAKKQLMRKLGDVNKNKKLAKLEKEILVKGNKLGIGPMGFGGNTTLLGVKIASLHRHPASFFVTIAYMCWADRRKTLVFR